MVITSQEDIDKQHEEARSLLRVMKCMEIVDHGEIPLEWKLHPTEGDPHYSSVEKPGMMDETNTADNENEEEKKENHNNNNINTSTVKHRACISSRAEKLDVSVLRELIEPGVHDAYREEVLRALTPSNNTDSDGNKEMYEKMQRLSIRNELDYWDPIHAAQKNVHVTRPSHDNWGIKKIVLKFCDDFLQRVYDMPWWWQPNSPFASLLRPILSELKFEEKKIVRMLLAALPPNTTIPVHHDTGAWVQHTHRVHIPVLVEDTEQVLFRCGPSVTTLQRISCHEGHVFEMNNQAKHAVSNCHSTAYRVHLILDYVDPSYQLPDPVQLQPGEMMIQTRRTIDPLSQAGTRPTPTYLILGVQKSGTTSLYDYLNQHPLIIRARRRETHCLDWRWKDIPSTTIHKKTKKKKSKADIVQEERKHCWKFYFQKELQRHPSLLTGDSTPSYLLDYVRTIPRCQRVFPHMNKFFVMLRDPVQRTYSQYNMVTSLDGSPEQIKARGTEWIEKSFEEVIQIDLQRLHQDGVIPYWNMTTQTVDEKLFQEFINTPQEAKAFHKYVSTRIALNTGSHSLVSRGLYALQLNPWLKAFDETFFCIMELKQFSKQLRCHMDRAFQHLQLPPVTIDDPAPKNARAYTQPMNESTKQMLQRFYAPHNQRLQQLLTSKQTKLNLITSWDQNPWPYQDSSSSNNSIS